jgi:uncharacterized protein YfaS (alpha-2-macroglobulin family)
MIFRLPTLLVAALFLAATSFAARSRDDQWKQVEEAADGQLPKTAIERLEPIIAAALAEQRYAEATKAIVRKITLEGEIQGGKAEEVIVRLEAEIAKAPADMKPVMEAILAHWYWSYFQQNRWRFLQRTQTAAAPGADIQTWDLARILAEIDRHFTAALADAPALQRIPIATFDELLTAGTVPDAYRPTLFDFLAHDALAFYQAGEQGAVVAEDEFELDAAGPIFAPVEEFLRWQPAASDSGSSLPKAVALYQQLLRFHAADADRSAYFDADLARLSFAFNSSVGEAKDERYVAALERFAATTADHEISARALALLAQYANDHDDPARAHELARRGLAAFPRSAGGALCYNLVQQLEAKSAQLATEFVWNAPWPTLDVTYRNITKVHFRAVPVDFAAHLARAHWQIGEFDGHQQTALLALPPALAWSAELPATPDYRTRTEKLAAPATLPPGFYAIIASYDPAFALDGNLLCITPVWVADLALVTFNRSDRTPDGGFVLQATTGEPVAGATVRPWERKNNGRYETGIPTRTDANGRFVLPGDARDVILVAEHGGQRVSSHDPIYNYGRNVRERAQSQTIFFTDRALYRPGQTINYKGISYSVDRAKGSYETLARERVEVVFNDPNGKEIARTSHVTNDYGSFSGVFTAPRDRLAGVMTLQVTSGPTGLGHFRVEEYKRPKFEVAIDAPAEAAKLDAPAVLTGRATSYTGAAIGGAKVKWRVMRGTRMPRWCWWWQPPPNKAVAHGTAVTGADGTFPVEFIAAPDRAVPAKLEPVFTYTIHADVTDTTGETRSADRGIAAGYTALAAEVSAGAWQTPDRPVEFTIATRSLDGDPQAATGTLTVHALRQPAKVERAPLQSHSVWWRAAEPPVDPKNPDSWETASVVATVPFRTDATGVMKTSVPLPAGIYRASLATQDRFGKPVTTRETIEVIDPSSRIYGVKVPNVLTAPSWSVEPGEKFTAVWGTGYASGRAFVEIEADGKSLQSYWTEAGRTQQAIELPVTEAMRGGASLRVTFVRENRAYLHNQVIDVPWSNKVLAVKWEHFRSKLAPGDKETWTATVSGPDATRQAAEMVATLYDASLDQFSPHFWPAAFAGFRREFGRVNATFQNRLTSFSVFRHGWQVDSRAVAWDYRAFPEELVIGPAEERIMLSAFSVGGQRAQRARPMAVAAAAAPMDMSIGDIAVEQKQELRDSAGPIVPTGGAPGMAAPPPPAPNLDAVTARKNLNETAFFFPRLLAGEDGTVKLQFTMPEALTRWKFLGFAHDQDLRAGLLTSETVTAKDLMVEPNPPRFVREGDTIEFTVKVSNQGDQRQSGKVRLTFAEAATLGNVDVALGNRAPEQAFEIPAKESRSFSWRIAIPDGMGFLTYKAVGASSTLSDGEEGFLPVLSRRILVTESLPLPIRGKTTKEFNFTKLIESGQSGTLRHQSFTVQMVSQPAWYAVMSLPYLMEYPYECSEQLFNRLYANGLARHIANSDPKIRRVFDLWKNTPALDSPLLKNEDLKSVLIEETPWLRQADRESESRRNVGLLFDANRLDEEAARALQQLADRQGSDGLWAWFPGGRSNEYISLYIMTGFGRLRHLGVDLEAGPALKSLAALDNWMEERYREIQRQPNPEKYILGYSEALYLYGRSFFLKDRSVEPEHQAALDFFLRRAREAWTKVGSRQSQAHLALALQRFGDRATPAAIAKSLKERSVTSEELGMFWRDTERSWWWYHAPIETQAMMIEVFSEVARDERSVADCQVWLLKQKQTQDWKTTKATADAVYALLLQGSNLLASDALVEVSLAGVPLRPENVEAGTGFYERKFVRNEIKPAMGQITVKKVDDGVSWGSATWQYLEDMTQVTAHEGTPLKLKKALFVKENTAKGPVLKAVTGPVAVGDELVVRVELRTDRDMEYVHLKDQRGSGTEPVNVLSRHRYQDGLAYYESTRDTASHFFIEYLPKGTYVFEYSTRVQLKGQYQSGIAEIQCMYAPEFNSHSESLTIRAE